MNGTVREVHQYLIDHPDWHYAVDIVKSCGVGARAVFLGLPALVEEGYAEIRDEPESSLPVPRPQYRATGKQWDEDEG